MRSLSTLFMVVVVGTAAHAQLSLLPQIGLENSSTSININNTGFNPLGTELSPRASLRLDYKFKKGHGPFVGVGTSPSVVTFNFTDPRTALNQFKTATGNMQLRLEGGYGFTTKPIQLSKSAKTASTKANRTSLSKAPAQKSVTTRTQQKSCGSYSYRTSCGSKTGTKTITRITPPKDNWNLRIQPSVGAAYIPSIGEDLAAVDGAYRYNAGNWNTALLSGVGFEFGKGLQRKFTLSVYHLKGIGNLDTKTLTTVSDGKSNVTQFNSNTSSWSAAVGIPFTLSKKKAVQKSPVIYKTQPKQENKKENCEQLKKRCGGGIRA